MLIRCCFNLKSLCAKWLPYIRNTARPLQPKCTWNASLNWHNMWFSQCYWLIELLMQYRTRLEKLQRNTAVSETHIIAPFFNLHFVHVWAYFFLSFSPTQRDDYKNSKHRCTGAQKWWAPRMWSLSQEMKSRAKEISPTYQVSWDEGSVGNRSLDSQHVHIWQSFAQGRPTQRHCVHVIGTLQQQMKLSAGRWLSSDRRSALSLHGAANKYVGFQSCQGRRWTVGQGAKHRAKAFPSPCNLLSMSLVTSLGHPFSVSHPKGPGGPQISHTACRGILWASLSPTLSPHRTAITLSLLCASLHFSKTSLCREK